MNCPYIFGRPGWLYIRYWSIAFFMDGHMGLGQPYGVAPTFVLKSSGEALIHV